MVRAAQSGSPATTSSFASLERTLERTIERLTKGEPSSETRALLIEARRLRSVIANWRSIPPPEDVYDEMLDRVLHLSTAAGASLYEPAPDSLRDELGGFNAGKTEFDAGKTELDDGMSFDDSKTELTGPPRRSEIPPAPRPAPAPRRRDPEPDPDISTTDLLGDDTQVYSADFEPRAYTQEGSVVERAARALGIPPPVIGSNVPAARAHLAAVQQQQRTPPRIPAAPRPARFDDDDPPSYPTSSALDPRPYPIDPPSYPNSVDDPPSYPHVEFNRGMVSRADIAPRPAPQTQARTPSYPPARSSSHPPPYRSNFPPAMTTGERLRSQAPPELVTEPAPEESAEIAPQTSVTVHAVAIAEKVDPHLVLLSDAYSPRADAYRALRRKLGTIANTQIIAVTSPDPGEGKTTCALNLALAIRETSRGKVLVIEANVRAPSIAKALGFETPECFCDQLLGHREDPRRAWVAVEPLPKLHIMAVDPKIKRAPLLDPIAFAAGMERLKRAGYEYVILDTPPVLGSFEVNMIADAVEGMLFTSITMKSKKGRIKKAIEQIQPAPILGVMVLDS